MFKIPSPIHFIALLFLLTTFMTGCIGLAGPMLPALGTAVQLGSTAWVTLPGGLKVKKENNEPFKPSMNNVKTVLVERPETYEILKGSKLFPTVKFIERHPRIMEEAVKLANQNGGDAYVWIKREGMGAKGMTVVHQRANIRIILANGECAYDQTIVISKKSGLLGGDPSLDEVEKHLIETFVKDLQGYMEV